MLAGIYYGAQYGGTITSVLLRLPGKRPRWSPFSTGRLGQTGQGRHRAGHRGDRFLCGATISIVGLTFLAPVVAVIALDFGPPEYAALALLGGCWSRPSAAATSSRR